MFETLRLFTNIKKIYTQAYTGDKLLRKFDQNITEGILFTDQYELVMSQLYFNLGLQDKHVVFDHFFRKYPDYGSHKAGYCINAGLEWFIDWMQNARFRNEELEFLRNHKNSKGERIFKDDFLNWLKSNGNFQSLTIRAVPEGRCVHPNEPLTIVEGPLVVAQIVETALLNQINFQTLIATKASRIKEICRNQPVLEFGARRAQDRGAIAAVRGALIGGADFSSNAGISYLLGYPPKGTHAHSMVQLFLSLGMSELEAFQAFADLYPDDCILLVDTINTLESGIPNAIKTFEKLKAKGHAPQGIRLDSGDLAYLSVKAVKMLNQAGFTEARVVLSNELDEMNIWQIITQIGEEAPKEGLTPDEIITRLVYGVGTRLVTSEGEAALGGVYKLVAVENNGWIPVIKISESVEKIPNPGQKELFRIYDNSGKANADLVTLKGENPGQLNQIQLIHHSDQNKSRTINRKDYPEIESLLQTIVENGNTKYEFPDIEEIRKTRDMDLRRLDAGVRRLINPHTYHVSISPGMFLEKQKLQEEMKSHSAPPYKGGIPL
ncbi:MAG: nicotinate phosphoribosyltransferase [Ignavibacteria bacterium]|jgi:nicotinate phosphoribosyltransferase|nr:nicotinate phosphoribosyltransferase [Ignavibacteria bacterium]MCU7504019.1 nicotinate phosphoribosyltransferase [Ignavibacteria bacterium]MCU7515391.1 nicotinate phosphoribosyltransferase [Ignavibacteria bacterium]